jgi:hypothetical protein
MERVIIVGGKIVFLFECGRKRKPTRRLRIQEATAWVLRGFLKRIFAESAKRYRRSTCQRSSRGVATKATGVSGVTGENLHRYVQT